MISVGHISKKLTEKSTTSDAYTRIMSHLQHSCINYYAKLEFIMFSGKKYITLILKVAIISYAYRECDTECYLSI